MTARYVLDATCFIQAGNFYYRFDICPGYWDWLDQQIEKGVVYSLDMIASEVKRQDDKIADWVKKKDKTFFLETMDNLVSVRVTSIAQWVTSQDYKERGIRRFLNGADPFLIAFAMQYGYTVVTDERDEPGIKTRVKIPAVCNHFNVLYVSLFECLRLTGAELVLASTRDENYF